MPSRPLPLLIVSVFGLTASAFLGGYITSAIADPPPAPPIVNTHAWEERGPAPPVQPVNLVKAAPAQACNPWEVSDVAMEEILRDMQRRGWRPPSQGDAVESLVEIGVDGIDAVDPGAPMPRRGDGETLIEVLTDDEAEDIRNGLDVESPVGATIRISPS